jgi:transketolase
VMFAAHKRLSSLIAIVDVNGQQALGYTRDVIDLEPLGRRWSAFGWDVQEVDGHDTEALQEAIASASAEVERPHVLLARTTFGRGVSFMENQIAWHYWPLSDEQLAQAVAEVESVMARDQTAGRR